MIRKHVIASAKGIFYRAKISRQVPATILRRSPYCAYCGGVATQVHHTAYIRGQWSNPAFPQPICRRCHEEIHARRLRRQKPRSALWTILRWLLR